MYVVRYAIIPATSCWQWKRIKRTRWKRLDEFTAFHILRLYPNRVICLITLTVSTVASPPINTFYYHLLLTNTLFVEIPIPEKTTTILRKFLTFFRSHAQSIRLTRQKIGFLFFKSFSFVGDFRKQANFFTPQVFFLFFSFCFLI